MSETAIDNIYPKNIVGSKYYTHVLPRLEEIYKWLCEGMTEYSIARELGIGHNTFIEYKKQHEEIIEVFTRARTHKNALVMHKQYEKAIGYEHKDLFIAQYQGKIVEQEIIKYYPPDVQAADLYLRNNDPDYKSAKSEGIVINNTTNFQMDKYQEEKLLLDQERKRLEALVVTDYEVIEDKVDDTK